MHRPRHEAMLEIETRYTKNNLKIKKLQVRQVSSVLVPIYKQKQRKICAYKKKERNRTRGISEPMPANDLIMMMMKV